LTIALYNAVQVQTPETARANLWRSLFASDVFLPALVVATGGVRSPFVPALLSNVIIMVVLWRRRQALGWLLGGFAVVAVLLAIAPGAVTGPPIAAPYFEIMTALSLVTALYVVMQIVLGVSDSFISSQRTLSSVRERLVESAVQRMRSLEQVGSKVAHELKNPLAAVKSLLQLEEQVVAAADASESPRPDGERSRRRLEVMSREVARMEAVLRDYLSFSRPLEDLRIGAVDLAEIADTIVVLLEGRAAEAGIRMQRTGESVPVGGDARRLEEALLNIAANAIEATPAGGAVTIRTERREGGAAIVVQDSGRGMSPAVLEKVGTPFYTTRREGTGLGVVLARAALAQHGGCLEYASQPGEGTTVTMALPDRLRITGAIGKGMIHT